jgi:hypothetical protein
MPIPRLDAAIEVVTALESRSIVVALGGSGLLAALGLLDEVRDWDLTTDENPRLVEAALDAAGLRSWSVAAGDLNYTTQARFCVPGDGCEVDLIVGFGIRYKGEIVHLPTRVTGQWRGLPLGDPVTWELTYRILGRTARAEALQRWLDDQGRPSAVAESADRPSRPAGRSR